MYHIVSAQHNKGFETLHYVYAHGWLEDDLDTDIVTIKKGDEPLRNDSLGFLGSEYGKAVRFFLYEHPTFKHLTGIVCYTHDIKACEFGMRLVENQPIKF